MQKTKAAAASLNISGLALLAAAALVFTVSARAQGRLYVVDNGNSHLNVYDATTAQLLNSFTTPLYSYGVAADSAGNYYLSYGQPNSTDYVAKYNSAGSLVTSWGTNGIISGVGGPEGIPTLSLNPAQTSLLVPFRTSSVNEYDTVTGSLLSSSVAGGTPYSATYNSSGTQIFVAENVVERIPAGGGSETPLSSSAGFLSVMYGIYFQSDTSFLITGAAANKIQRYTLATPTSNTATLDTTFGASGPGYTYVFSTYGLAASTNGNLFVSDYSSGSIGELTANGTIITTTFISGLSSQTYGIAYSSIPEPGTDALLGAGLCGLGLLHFRRRRN